MHGGRIRCKPLPGVPMFLLTTSEDLGRTLANNDAGMDGDTGRFYVRGVEPWPRSPLIRVRGDAVYRVGNAERNLYDLIVDKGHPEVLGNY